MSARGTGSFIRRGWRNVREAGSQRLALTAVLLLAALLLARFSWSLPGIADAEAYLFDGRSYDTAEQVEQDQRILMVVYTDQTLMNLQKRSPLDRGLLAEALRNLDSMDAKAIGIDILFDQPQQEDAELIETLARNADSGVRRLCRRWRPTKTTSSSSSSNIWKTSSGSWRAATPARPVSGSTTPAALPGYGRASNPGCRQSLAEPC